MGPADTRVAQAPSPQRLQILCEIGFLRSGESERLFAVVVLHHRLDRGKMAVVVESAFRLRGEPAQRGGAIATVVVLAISSGPGHSCALAPTGSGAGAGERMTRASWEAIRNSFAGYG